MISFAHGYEGLNSSIALSLLQLTLRYYCEHASPSYSLIAHCSLLLILCCAVVPSSFIALCLVNDFWREILNRHSI